MQQPELLDVFVAPLDQAGIGYMVTGSVATIFYGEPRLTHDVDIVLHLDSAEIDTFCGLFPLETYYCPPPEVIRIELRRETAAHFNLIHHETGLKADCYPIGRDQLHAWAFPRRKRVVLSEFQSLWLAPVEYIIIRKLQYFREGRSQKHLSDIRKVFAVSGDLIDMNFLRESLAQLDLERVWQETGLDA